MIDIHEAYEIVSSGFNDVEYVEPDYLKAKAGPNSWKDVKPEDFGPEHDYETTDLGDRWVVHPISNAALQWCDSHFHENIDRWCTGYVVEVEYIKFVLYWAKQDGLMSEDEYNEAQEEAHALARQWDD